MATVIINSEVATPWFWRPAGKILERLDWKTEIFQNYDGTEQRRALRLSPRRWFEYECLFAEGVERRYAENQLDQLQGRLLALPIWMDAQPLASALTVGQTVIPLDNTTREFATGRFVGFVSPGSGFNASGIKWETMNITAVAGGGTTITVGSPGMANAWPAGTIAFPIRGARLEDSVGVERFTGDVSGGRFLFECVEQQDVTAATGETAYRSIPVMTYQPVWTEDIDQGFARTLVRLDNQIGRRWWDEITLAAMLQSHRWVLNGRTELAAWRAWLYARRGRNQHFWMPSHAQDFQVVATIGSADTTIDVEHSNYVAAVAQNIGRRDIQITTRSGTVYRRRITASSVVNATTERLTIDSALGATVTAPDVAAVSFLRLMRLEQDAIELLWHRFDLAESKIMTRSARNDL